MVPPAKVQLDTVDVVLVNHLAKDIEAMHVDLGVRRVQTVGARYAQVPMRASKVVRVQLRPVEIFRVHPVTGHNEYARFPRGFDHQLQRVGALCEDIVVDQCLAPGLLF